MQENQEEPKYLSLKGAALLVDEYLFHENNQGLAVVLPFLWQLTFVGILVTANIDGELKAVGVQVAEVIDACQYWGKRQQLHILFHLLIRSEVLCKLM